MKIHPWLFLGCLCFGSAAVAVHAEQAFELVEELPTGSINWTRGVARATGTNLFRGSIQGPSGPTGQEKIIDEAYQQAVQNLMSTLSQMRMNDQNDVADLLSIHEYAQARVEEMTAAARVVRTLPLPDGNVEVAVEMSLYGGFAQLMLPPNIRQVDSIKPLNGSKSPGVEKDQANIFKQRVDRSDPEAYTGLLVDARGVGARPSMVPVLLDENGQEVYGPAYVSREFAVQHGMCRYIRGGMDGAAVLPQVAPNPLIVKGLRTVTEGSCDIVISNADASILRGTSSHLEFLKQCRVVIVLD